MAVNQTLPLTGGSGSPRSDSHNDSRIFSSVHKGKGSARQVWTWVRVRMLHMGIGGVVATLVGGAIFIAFVAHRIVAHTLTTSQYYEAPIHQIPRQCPAPDYLTLEQVQRATPSSSLTSTHALNASHPLQPKICVTTLTDQLQADWKQKLVKWRQFNDLLTITWPNKQAWCDMHGYHLVDSSPYLDNSRPPSWSKIVAARRLLVEEHCDWVLWLDADTVIMNSTKRIESFLPAPNATHDFVVTRQKSDSFNAGAWAIRNTPWAIQFLDDWWNMDSFVRPKGLSVSGDNDALYNFLKEKMPNETFQKHIRVPPRCQFNSNTKWITKKEFREFEQNPDLVKEEDYYMHLEYYHKGDLVAHIAGRNNKVDTTKIMLQHAT